MKKVWPKSIVFGAHVFKVVDSPDDGPYLGAMDWDNQELQFWRGLTSSQRVEIALHEIVHVLLRGLVLEEREEEQIAGTIGKGLAEFIKDNPKWVKCFLQVFKEEQENASD